jgi:hypothetical protein
LQFQASDTAKLYHPVKSISTIRSRVTETAHNCFSPENRPGSWESPQMVTGIRKLIGDRIRWRSWESAKCREGSRRRYSIQDFIARLQFCQPREISKIWIWARIDQPLRFLVLFDYQWQWEILVWWHRKMHLFIWLHDISSSWTAKPGEKGLEDSI